MYGFLINTTLILELMTKCRVREHRYEDYARACRRFAQQAKSSQEKDLLVRMAEAWLRLAERAGGLQNPDGDSRNRSHCKRHNYSSSF